jgi:hypothetical protein
VSRSFSFLALTVAFHLGGILKRLSSITEFGARFFDQFKSQAPVLSLLATCGLYSLAPFRELEQHLLAWMHNTRHLRGDVRTLGQHLEECVLLPSPEERRRNIESLEAFHVYVTDQQLQTINLSSVATWRKTGSLLRHLRQWNASRSRIMSDEEIAALDELEEAHGRKTRLAMDIIRTLDSVGEGAGGSEVLSVTEILSRASHDNRQEISEAEALFGLQRLAILFVWCSRDQRRARGCPRAVARGEIVARPARTSVSTHTRQRAPLNPAPLQGNLSADRCPNSWLALAASRLAGEDPHRRRPPP